MKLAHRLMEARETLERVEPKYCIAWEDPDDPDKPVQVTVPSPEWLACAIHGGVLPPVEVYHAIEDTTVNGKVDPVAGAQLHEAPRMPPMTEEQAMEYILKKDVPRRVWEQPRNRQMFYIVPRDEIPSNRTFRNAWELNQ